MKTNAIMRNGQRTATVRDWMAEKINNLNTWYNCKSEFYSKLCGFEVTRKLATRINLLAVFVMIAVVVAFQQPIVTLTAAACSAWMVCGLNREEEKGGDDENC